MTHEPPTKLEQVLEARGRAYGSFDDNAHLCLAMRDLFRRAMGWDLAGPAQRLALDEIALKVARLLSADASDPDTWLDIAGYAEQGRLACGRV